MKKSITHSLSTSVDSNSVLLTHTAESFLNPTVHSLQVQQESNRPSLFPSPYISFFKRKIIIAIESILLLTSQEWTQDVQKQETGNQPQGDLEFEFPALFYSK